MTIEFIRAAEKVDTGERLYWHPAAPPIPWLEPRVPSSGGADG